jgi:hypothetical protein
MQVRSSAFSFSVMAVILIVASALTAQSQVSVAGRWQVTGTGLETEAVSLRLELTQTGSAVSGLWVVGNDEIPIREGKVQENRLELITFVDDKLFTSVAAVEGDELKGTWKDDTGRSGDWQGKRLPAGAK